MPDNERQSRGYLTKLSKRLVIFLLILPDRRLLVGLEPLWPVIAACACRSRTSLVMTSSCNPGSDP